MLLSYIIHTENIVEFIISKEIKNKYYIATLEYILKTNNILDPCNTLSFYSNFESTTTLSTFININYSHFNKILIPILEKNGFIVIPNANNKIFVYYIQHNENIIECFFDNNNKHYNEFIILGTFLKHTLETIKNNNSTQDTENTIFSVKMALSKHRNRIIIQSKYLFKELPQKALTGLPNSIYADSIMTFLKLNGFNVIKYETSKLKSTRDSYNKLIPK